MRPVGSIRAHQRRLHDVSAGRATDSFETGRMTRLFAAVDVPAESQPQSKDAVKRRPRFWLGPLVAGGCFALGFGLTQRIVALQGRDVSPQQESFAPQGFPGDDLERLQARHGGDVKPLRADVAAREAALAKTRPPKPKSVDKAKAEAERLAAEVRRRQQQAVARRTTAPSPVAAETMPAPALPPEEPELQSGAAALMPEPSPIVPRVSASPAVPVMAPAASTPLVTRPGISFPTQSPAFRVPAPPPTP